MAADAYGDNHGFRNLDEFNQFNWFESILPSKMKLGHNFYIFDQEEERDLEIDIGLLSDSLLLLIEHKRSYNSAYEVRNSKKMKSLYWKTKEFLKSRGCKEIPFIDYIVISNDKLYEYKKEPKIHVLPSEESTKSFSLKELPRIEDQARKYHKKPLSLQGTQNILRALNLKKYKYKPINESIFNIFNEIEERKTKKKDGKINKISKEDRNRLVDKMYDKFESINFILSRVFLEFDKERVNSGKSPIFNFHKALREDLKKLRPVYWVCATNSEHEDYKNSIQLGFHLSNGPYYGEDAVPENHLAIKLAFFEDIDSDSLDAFKTELEKHRKEFNKKALQLAKMDNSFTFYWTGVSRNDRRFLKDYTSNIDKISDDIIRYDLDEDGIAMPRSTEIVKYIVGNKEINDIFRNKDVAIRILHSEFSKLLPLYYFMTRQDTLINVELSALRS